MILLLLLLVNGLQLGAIYALTAVGFSLIFGATKCSTSRTARRSPSPATFTGGCARAAWPWPVARCGGRGGAVVFGLAMERFVYRPIQRHEGSFFTVFIAAFGVQIIVQNLIGTIFGRGFASVTTSLSRSVEVVPGLFVAPVLAISIGVAVVRSSSPAFYLSRTHIGMAMRALSENPDLIRVFGLDPGRVAQYAFAHRLGHRRARRHPHRA